MPPKIIIAIPCYNEEATISSVVRDFQHILPSAEVHVFDNNSTDRSVELALRENAVVHKVRKQGKGNVMRAIFDTLIADALIVVDGDGTYAASDAPMLLEPVLKGEADMVVGDRLKNANKTSLKSLNHFGNILINKTINLIFSTQYQDILSGYRVFNRRFVERVPLLTPQFETETEIALQALEEGLSIKELPIQYLPRPENSKSKLNPFSDGSKIMIAAGMLMRDHHPLRFYGFIGSGCMSVAVLAVIAKGLNYFDVTQVSEPFLNSIITFFVSIGIVIMGIGFVLSAINTKFRELKQVLLRNQKQAIEQNNVKQKDKELYDRIEN